MEGTGGQGGVAEKWKNGGTAERTGGTAERRDEELKEAVEERRSKAEDPEQLLACNWCILAGSSRRPGGQHAGAAMVILVDSRSAVGTLMVLQVHWWMTAWTTGTCLC